jgi:predicted negative regulator of RcsB-dependent stress response
VDRVTRKELKSDRFALEVGHTVEYVAGHRREVLMYVALIAGVLLISIGVYLYLAREHSTRQAELREALRLQDATIAVTGTDYLPNFQSQAEKDKAVDKALQDVASKYAGKDEGEIARYYLGMAAADKGKLDDAIKYLRVAADSASNDYASLARFSLAQVYQAQGKNAEAEKELRYLMDHPSILMSKEQATIELGKVLLRTKPDEGRKLLEPLRTQSGAVSRAAITALSEAPAKK